MDEYRIDTKELMNLLMMSRSLQSIMDSNDAEMGLPSFADHISALQQVKGETASEIIRRSQIEKSYGYKLFKGEREPSRDICLKLAFGFELGVDETQRLLRIAGRSTLYPRIPRDAAIIYCLHNHISLYDTQLILEKLGLPLISGGIKHE